MHAVFRGVFPASPTDILDKPSTRRRQDRMDLNFVDADKQDFDPRTYLRILVAIAKADKDNGPPEFDYVRRQADRLGLESEHFFKNTDKTFLIGPQTVSRLTALVILKDAIALASLDGNLSLPERMKIYTYAEKLDISRNDVDRLEKLLDEYRQLDDRWRQLVNTH
jgi:tellurite resistance protein